MSNIKLNHIIITADQPQKHTPNVMNQSDLDRTKNTQPWPVTRVRKEGNWTRLHAATKSAGTDARTYAKTCHDWFWVCSVVIGWQQIMFILTFLASLNKFKATSLLICLRTQVTFPVVICFSALWSLFVNIFDHCSVWRPQNVQAMVSFQTSPSLNQEHMAITVNKWRYSR